uniref:Uncharacterized protein n=1 Tax=Peronospora matthiolae TaxID=2874970 RepID=A0AAV1UKQ1_9STRA
MRQLPVVVRIAFEFESLNVLVGDGSAEVTRSVNDRLAS